MAEYPPPTEDLPIFDNSVFIHTNTETGYLEYPIAQGAETLKQITVQGLSTFNNNFIVNDFPTTFNNYSNGLTFYNFPKVGVYTGTPTSDQLITKYYADNTYNGSGLLTSNNVWQGTNTFLNYIPDCSITPTTNYQLTNKLYVDNSISSIFTTAHTWTASQAFNTICPSTNIAPTTAGHLTRKNYVDTSITTAISNLLGSVNTWTNANTFNATVNFSSLPICTTFPYPTPSTNNFIIKNYADSAYAPSNIYSTILAGTNAWTGTNTFNTNLPTSTLTPSSSTQLTTKSYTDNYTNTAITSLLAGTNAWTGTNTFNNNLPTSILTPTNTSDLTTKLFVDNSINYLFLATTSNIWGSNNDFQKVPTCNGSVTLSNQLTNKTYVDAQISSLSSSLLSSNNTWTGFNVFTKPIDCDGLTICGNDVSQVKISMALGSDVSISGGNIGIGYYAYNSLSSGTGNTGIGTYAGQNITSGSNNLFLGSSSGAGVVGGSNNLIVGSAMGVGISSPTNITNNIAIGNNSLNYVASNCGANTSIGAYALYNDSGSGFAGIYNTAIGPNAGVRLGTYGNQNCFIGGCYSASSNVSPNYSNFSYCTTIGVDAQATASNQIVLGTANETTYIKGNLDVSGSGKTINFGSIAPTMSGANITSNTIPDSALSSNIPLENGSNTFTNTNVFSGQTNINAITFNNQVSFNTYPQTLTTAQTGTTFYCTLTGTINLPAKANGLEYYIVNNNNVYTGGWITVVTNNSATDFFTFTNSANSYTMYVYGKYALHLRCNGSIWLVMNESVDAPRLTAQNVFAQPINIGCGGNTGAAKTYPLAGQSTAISTTGAYTMPEPLYNLYVLTGGSATNITLPQITSATIGLKILFRRINGTTNFNHTITASSTGSNAIIPYNGSTAVAGGTFTTLLSSTAVTAGNNYSVTLACINGTQWALC